MVSACDVRDTLRILTSIGDPESLQMQDLNGPLPAFGAMGDTHTSVLQHHGYRTIWLASFGCLVSETKAYLYSSQGPRWYKLYFVFAVTCTVWEEVTATKLLDGCTYHVLETRCRQHNICLCSDTCCVGGGHLNKSYTYIVLASR